MIALWSISMAPFSDHQTPNYPATLPSQLWCAVASLKRANHPVLLTTCRLTLMSMDIPLKALLILSNMSSKHTEQRTGFNDSHWHGNCKSKTGSAKPKVFWFFLNRKKKSRCTKWMVVASFRLSKYILPSTVKYSEKPLNGEGQRENLELYWRKWHSGVM